MTSSPPPARVTVSCAACGQLNGVDLERSRHGAKCARCGSMIDLGRPVPVGDADLLRVLQDADVPVLVDFYADWCGPCKIMGPVLDQVARDRRGAALVAKLDTDRSPEMAARFQIRGIPTLIAFRSGREVAREVGAVPRARLESLLDAAAGA